MVQTQKCTSCGVDWSNGEFSIKCTECGGGALCRPCPVCRGMCGILWRRAILDSRDEHIAHWIGGCALQKPDTLVSAHVESGMFAEWWLDGSALPDLYWACLISSPGERAVVVDLDGTEHLFADRKTATTWLREDEYESLPSILLDHCEIDRDASPPQRMIIQALKASKALQDGFV